MERRGGERGGERDGADPLGEKEGEKGGEGRGRQGKADWRTGGPLTKGVEGVGDAEVGGGEVRLDEGCERSGTEG